MSASSLLLLATASDHVARRASPAPRFLMPHGRSSPRPACGERSRASCERVRGTLDRLRIRIIPLTPILRCAPSRTSPRERGEVKQHAGYWLKSRSYAHKFWLKGMVQGTAISPIGPTDLHSPPSPAMKVPKLLTGPGTF